MSTATPSAPALGHATGPKTAEGKRIAARNATTHGLFARDVVLPRLGEDPQAYEAFLEELTRQLAPKNLMEQHYAEKIAAASWRLRRLHRWQAQLFEDAELPEDEVVLKLDRVMRHETTLHRQIDTSVKMLGRELPRLFEGRVREELIRGWRDGAGAEGGPVPGPVDHGGDAQALGAADGTPGPGPFHPGHRPRAAGKMRKRTRPRHQTSSPGGGR